MSFIKLNPALSQHWLSFNSLNPWIDLRVKELREGGGTGRKGSWDHSVSETCEQKIMKAFTSQIRLILARKKTFVHFNASESRKREGGEEERNESEKRLREWEREGEWVLYIEISMVRERGKKPMFVWTWICGLITSKRPPTLHAHFSALIVQINNFRLGYVCFKNNYIFSNGHRQYITSNFFDFRFSTLLHLSLY